MKCQNANRAAVMRIEIATASRISFTRSQIDTTQVPVGPIAALHNR